MELILLRHADAAPADGFADDSLRPLSDKGRRVQEQVGKAMRRMKLIPDRVLASPRLRARETAEITCYALDCDGPEQLQSLDGGYRVDDLIKSLSKLPSDETVLCVGHEPDLSTWTGQLLGPDQGPRVEFKKSALLGLSFDGAPAAGEGALKFFYRARDLGALV